MPYFESVGFIDDKLFPGSQDVVREYRRRYSIAAYHEHRRELVLAVSPRGTCEACDARVPAHFHRAVPLTLVWRDEEAEKQAEKLGINRVNKLVTAKAQTRSYVLKHRLVSALCSEHAKAKLWRKGTMTHGTYWAAYRHKCRCDECGEYRADYTLRRREDRRAAKCAAPMRLEEA